MGRVGKGAARQGGQEEGTGKASKAWKEGKDPIQNGGGGGGKVKKYTWQGQGGKGQVEGGR